jgi:hypothetical protein
MFEYEIAKESQAREGVALLSEEANDFLLAWQALKAELKDPVRLRRLEVKVDILWQKLSQEVKDAVWMVIFPEHRKVKETFSAHAQSIKQEGLCQS